MRLNRKTGNWILIIGGILAVALQMQRTVWISALGVPVIGITAWLVEPSVFRRIGKPRFWIVGLIITMLSGLLLGRDINIHYTLPLVGWTIPISYDGMLIGVKIVCRMLTFVLLIMTISRRMRRDVFVLKFA